MRNTAKDLGLMPTRATRQMPGPWAQKRQERAPLHYYVVAALLVAAVVFAVFKINDEPGQRAPAQTPVPAGPVVDEPSVPEDMPSATIRDLEDRVAELEREQSGCGVSDMDPSTPPCRDLDYLG